MARIVEPTRRAWPAAFGGVIGGLVMALVVQVAQAQAPDSLTASYSVRVVRDARLPRTEAEFLARYGANDSARALIRWWFRQRVNNQFLMIGSSAVVVAGVSIAAISIDKGSFGESIFGGAIGSLTALAGFTGMVVSAARLPRWSSMRLASMLTSPTAVEPYTWGLALSDNALRLSKVAADSARRNLHAAARAKKLSLKQQKESAIKASPPTTAEEAQRMQEDYWRQRGGMPKPKTKPRPKQQQR